MAEKHAGVMPEQALEQEVAGSRYEKPVFVEGDMVGNAAWCSYYSSSYSSWSSSYYYCYYSYYYDSVRCYYY